MKMNKKKILSMSLVIVLIAIMSFGTLAWFSDADEVTNKFMVASSEDDTADEIFSVDIFEEVDTNGDGDSKVEGEGDDAANPVYQDMLPGEERIKKPTVKNTGSYSQYVRVIVTLDNAKLWTDLAKEYDFELFDLFVGYNNAEWDRYGEQPAYNEDDTCDFIFYYIGGDNGKLEKGAEATLFTGVKIPGKLTQHDMIEFSGNQFSMKIVAEAVQTENLYKDGVPVDNAYDAFVVVEADQVIGA